MIHQAPDMTHVRVNIRSKLDSAFKNKQYETIVGILQSEDANTSECGYAFSCACENGITSIVQLLLKDERVDPTFDDNYSICMAAQNGHEKIVEFLLKDKRANPGAKNNLPIRIAFEKGYKEVAQLLLQDKRINPEDIDAPTIRLAIFKKYDEMVKLYLVFLRDKIFTANDCLVTCGIPHDLACLILKKAYPDSGLSLDIHGEKRRPLACP